MPEVGFDMKGPRLYDKKGKEVTPLRYDTILFDADDTLLDFRKAEKEALQKVFTDEGFLLDDALYESYRIINQKLWDDLERGLISKRTLTSTRFCSLFSQFGIAADGVEFNRKYIKALREGGYALDGATDLCRELAKRVRLFLVTNGIAKTQHRRIEKSGIKEFFSGIFISEEIGVPKPHRGFFDFVFSRIKDFDPGKTVIIGDSLAADITGGNKAGIATCWYNPGRRANETGVIPTYEIRELDEVWEICEIPRPEGQREKERIG